MKLNELYSKEEAIEVLNELKGLFSKMGFTVSYDSHALGRLLGRDESITKEQMVDTFKFLMMTQKKAFKPMRDKSIASMIVRDSHNLGNYVINFSDNHAKIMTAIKKKGFKSSNDRQNSLVVNLSSHQSRADAKVGIKEPDSPDESDITADELPPKEVSQDAPAKEPNKNTLTLKQR